MNFILLVDELLESQVRDQETCWAEEIILVLLYTFCFFEEWYSDDQSAGMVYKWHVIVALIDRYPRFSRTTKLARHKLALCPNR